MSRLVQFNSVMNESAKAIFEKYSKHWVLVYKKKKITCIMT
jgi:hypothetical protein